MDVTTLTTAALNVLIKSRVYRFFDGAARAILDRGVYLYRQGDRTKLGDVTFWKFLHDGETSDTVDTPAQALQLLQTVPELNVLADAGVHTRPDFVKPLFDRWIQLNEKAQFGTSGYWKTFFDMNHDNQTVSLSTPPENK